MRISYIRIENFRNFRFCEVELGRNIVLVGENRAGKSNFIHALRLILDPTLPDQDRYLTEHDFWDGDQPFGGREIKITVRFSDFANDDHPDYLALLWLSASLISTEPPIAQLTYIYYNDKKPATPSESKFDDYEFKICAGNDLTQEFSQIHGMRKNIPVQLISALRDIASDTQSWRRSPLRRLVDLSDVKVSDIESFADRIQIINQDISKLPSIVTLEKDIQERFTEMVGKICASVPSLSLSAITATELIKSLTLYMDGGKRRDIERISLGLQNALYLALLSLLLDRQQIKKMRQRQRFMPVLALEEPEAHLHPHLQRLIFNDFLERARKREQPVVISTHSPHIVSVTDLEDIVLLKDVCEVGSNAQSALSFVNTLELREKKDLQRFIDVTRAEIFFCKGVIFVEGDVEALLIAEFAEILEKPLDNNGISLCNVNGAYFSHVVTLAHNFSIPFIVLTDGDKYANVTGIKRAIDLLENIKPVRFQRLRALHANSRHNNLEKYLNREGIFVNSWTFEVSLLECNNHDILKNVFEELGQEINVKVRAGIDYIDNYLNDPTDDNLKKILASIADSRWGKGRFAHRLLKHLRAKAQKITSSNAKADMIPIYIRNGIEYLLAQIQS